MDRTQFENGDREWQAKKKYFKEEMRGDSPKHHERQGKKRSQKKYNQLGALNHVCICRVVCICK